LIFDEYMDDGMLIAPGTVQLEGLDQSAIDKPVLTIEILISLASKVQRLSRVRFEIGQGGGFAILGGLLGLSAAVIVLGMISDHEVTQREQGQSAGACAAPSPSPPHAAQTLSLASLGAENMLAATVLNKSHQIKTPPQSVLEAVSSKHHPTPRVQVPHDLSPSPDYSAPLDKTGTGADERTAHAPRASTKIHHPRYKIVIAAAPDRAAAVRMASRLLSLGYASHIVPSQIDGQTWYRVQVGPYPTSISARAIQAKLLAALAAR
jgi:cell division septation protein DedD